MARRAGRAKLGRTEKLCARLRLTGSTATTLMLPGFSGARGRAVSASKPRRRQQCWPPRCCLPRNRIQSSRQSSQSLFHPIGSDRSSPDNESVGEARVTPPRHCQLSNRGNERQSVTAAAYACADPVKSELSPLNVNFHSQPVMAALLVGGGAGENASTRGSLFRVPAVSLDPAPLDLR